MRWPSSRGVPAVSGAKVSYLGPLSLMAAAAGTFISLSLSPLFPSGSWLEHRWAAGGKPKHVCTGLAREPPGSEVGGAEAASSSAHLVHSRGQVVKTLWQRRCKHDAYVICTHAHGRILSRRLNTWFFQAPRSSSPPLPEESLNPNFIILVPIKFFFFPN